MIARFEYVIGGAFVAIAPFKSADQSKMITSLLNLAPRIIF